MIFQKYIRTDLAAESPVVENKQDLNGVEVNEYTLEFCKALIIKITSNEGKELLGRDKIHPNFEGGQIVANNFDLEIFR